MTTPDNVTKTAEVTEPAVPEKDCFLHIDLCAGCIEDLKEYNPYIYGDGSPVPRDRIKVHEVSIEDCCNSVPHIDKGDKVGVFKPE